MRETHRSQIRASTSCLRLKFCSEAQLLRVGDFPKSKALYHINATLNICSVSVSPGGLSALNAKCMERFPSSQNCSKETKNENINSACTSSWREALSGQTEKISGQKMATRKTKEAVGSRTHAPRRHRARRTPGGRWSGECTTDGSRSTTHSTRSPSSRCCSAVLKIRAQVTLFEHHIFT